VVDGGSTLPESPIVLDGFYKSLEVMAHAAAA